MSQLVTFTTVPANAISHTALASGQLLSYKMIVGVQVGSQSVRFRHPEYEVEVNREARESKERIAMPSLVAARIIAFAKACFVKPGVDYDGIDFTYYVSGLQPTPQHRSHGSLEVRATGVSVVDEMACHFIGLNNGRVLHSFIGLAGQRALSVLGHQGTFGISRVEDLMRVYGGTRLGRLDPPALPGRSVR